MLIINTWNLSEHFFSNDATLTVKSFFTLLFPYFPKGEHSRWIHMIDLAKILHQMLFLMQAFQLSRLGTSTGSELDCDPLRPDFHLLPNQGSFTCKANVLTTTHVAHHKHFIIHPVNYRISAWIKCHDGLQVLHMDENCVNTIFFCFLFKGIMQFLHAEKWLMWKCNLTLKYEQCGYIIKLRLIWSMSCTLNNVPLFLICITKDVSFSF